jgi:broad specificity phosphatase PhoE
MLIYLRHGDDRGGDDPHRHDRRVRDRGRAKAARAAKKLIEKYGHPDVVHFSPYRRAVDTLHAMSTRFSREVTTHADRRLAQRLSGKQQRDPRISPETRALVPVIEDKEAFRGRVAAHVAEVIRLPGVIWCITHRAVIEEVARQLGLQISEKLDFVDHIVARTTV